MGRQLELGRQKLSGWPFSCDMTASLAGGPYLLAASKGHMHRS